MPLEFVTSNAGHPMLVIDRYTFHRHSSNPKTGRTNWRCSRRRVKDIRCTSSCHSIGDTSSQPSSHDPNCMPLTNSELMAYEIKREKLNNSITLNKKQDTGNNNNNNKNLTFSQSDLNDTDYPPITHLFNGDTYNTSHFQSREINSDDEELNDVLNNLDDKPDTLDNENVAGVSQIDNLDNGDCNSNIKQESLDSIIQDFVEPNNTISDLIDDCEKPDAQPIENFNSFSQNNGDECSTYNTKSISFVTSKVGHPMLVFNKYTFHKHSTNPKTNRINWRCSRRRVKEIRCSSSCYTVDGIVSNPTPHDFKCAPLTDELLKNYQNKRVKVLPNNFINTKADSFTTLKNRIIGGGGGSDEYSENNEYETSSLYEDYNDSEPTVVGFSTPKFQLARNKRKENCPIRANENFDEELDDASNRDAANLEANKDSSNDEEFFENDLDYNGSEKLDEFTYYPNDDEDNSQESNADVNQFNQKNATEPTSEAVATSSSAVGGDYDNVDYSSSPQSFAKLVSELNEMKRREKLYIEKLKRANTEIDNLKKNYSHEIQSLKWKSKMMEIDKSSLRSKIHQKNIENIDLKKLVDEMLVSKLKGGFK